MGFFESIGNLVDSIFSLIENSANSDLVNQLAVLFSITLTITVLIKGFAVLAGKSQEPVKELVWDMTLKVMIITFALNIGGWLDLVTNAMEGLHEWAGGGVSLYSLLDDVFIKTRDLANIAWEKGNVVTGALSFAGIYVGFGIGAVPALYLIIITSLTLKILIMLAPFMFFALLYGWLKNMFTQWLSLFFANTLTVLIITLIFKAIINKFENFIDYSKVNINSGVDVFFIAFQVITVGILFYILVYTCKGIAEKLATVSMESLMQSGFGRTLDPVKKLFDRNNWSKK